MADKNSPGSLSEAAATIMDDDREEIGGGAHESDNSVKSGARAIEAMFGDGDASDTHGPNDAAQYETDDQPEDFTEGDSEDDEGNEESENDDVAPQPAYRVKIGGGEEIEVTLPELINGYSRQADYTRKTQALTAQRKEMEAKHADVDNLREGYIQRIEMAEQFLGQFSPEAREALQADYAAVKQEQAHSETERMARYLAEEREQLHDKIPEWKDSARAKAEKAELVQFAKQHGYTQEELAGVNDHRALVILRMARNYQEVVTKGREKLQVKVKPVLKPGAPNRDNSPRDKRSREYSDASKRLVRTGNSRDAARAIEFLLP